MIKVKVSFETEEEKSIVNDILALKGYEIINKPKIKASDNSPYNKIHIDFKKHHKPLI